MSILFTILLIFAGLLALIMIIAALTRREHFVSRSITIDAPVQKVFDYLKRIQNQDTYNKWAKAGEERKVETKGTDGTVGYVYSWSGKGAGEGEKEIKEIVVNERIENEIRFVKPFKAVAHFVMTTESLGDNSTKVTWSNRSALKYPLNIMVPMVEKSLKKDMDESLVRLKEILEKQSL